MDISSKIELVTPEMARKLRDIAHFERQRKMRPKNISRLAEEIKAGRLTDGTQIYLCELPNGELRIANGNHTLEAICEAQKPQLLTVTKKKVADLDEVGSIYAVFDIQAARSWSDSAKAVGLSDEIPHLSKVLPAVKVIMAGFTASSTANLPRPVVLEEAQKYKREAELFAGIVRSSESDSGSLLRRSGILAVLLETLKYQPSQAYEFWMNASKDDGLAAGQPEKALLNWMRKNSSAGGTFQVDNAFAAALSWNSFFRDEERKQIRVNRTNEFYILGTPHHDGVCRGNLILESADEGDGSVKVGSIVSVTKDGEAKTILLSVCAEEHQADHSKGLVWEHGIVGSEMMGLRQGEKFEISIAGVTTSYTIDEVV